MDTTGTRGTILLLLFLPYLSIAVDIYRPRDLFSINCGSPSDMSTQDGQKWIRDSVKFLSESHDSIAAPALTPCTEPGPYTSARLSYSQFTYSFPVTAGPKFLRLFFFSTSYQNFDRPKAYFSVKSGEYTLLKDFNASINADAYADDVFFKEYCINLKEGQRLNITFIPRTSAQYPDSYAFINAIQIVSMPPYLYYTNPDDNIGFQVADTTLTQTRLENNSALFTKYRLRVAGSPINPLNDTGMLRTWDSDQEYLTSRSGPSYYYGSSLKLNFTKETPEYTAPDQVYLTLRNMGMNGTLNMEFNLTWQLPVDPDFTYMLRLHFCELDPLAHEPGDRMFRIYVDDQMVEATADVLKWTNRQKGQPVIKNYAVFIPQNQANLSIKMHPYPKSRIRDALLNAIELFKINDSTGSLAGPNPDPPSHTPQLVPLQRENQKNGGTKKTLAVIVGAASIIVLASIIGIIVFQRRRSSRDHDEEENSWKTRTEGSTLPSHRCRYFTIAEIRAATNNFDDVFIVGVGGFGNVYKGYIDGATPVAIKRLKPGSQQGENEFLNEIKMLSELRHHNLVSLTGYCNDGVEMILVYDFMQRGTLREYLYGSDNQPLSWKQRLEILLGAARGLHYLHEGAKYNIIHRDVKSTNILLDEKWVAKVSDFGLSKVGPTGMSTTHVSTIVKGSLGYLDPEYYKRQRLTLKSDVYSFGVVLLEVLCARPPLVRTLTKEKVSLVDWFRRCYEREEIDQTVDPFIKDSISADCLKCYCQVALNCLLDDGNRRPKMNDVVGMLEFAMQLVESAEDKNSGAEDKGKSEQRPLLVSQFISDEGSDVPFTSTETEESGSKSSKVSTVSGNSEGQALFPATVFSEIGNPRAR